ncbi:MAG: glycerophosphodiester phosphodiesterase family protein [Chthonomonadales bacterium]|nr:glycerophosphodiester phosphodiesterase family protein [Chthonomonadales bacterium]
MRLTIAMITMMSACSLVPAVTSPKARPPVLVVAHRGGAGVAPENTLTAFRKAIRLRADYVEVDVGCSADGHLVVMHDRTVDRTTNGTGDIAKLTLAEIGKLAIRSDRFPDVHERVPTFEAVVRLCRARIGLYIDHKDAPVGEVMRVLDALRFGRKAIVYGSPDRLAEYRRLMPAMAIMPGHPADLAAMDALVSRLHPEAMDGHLLEWTREQVDEAHRRGATVWMDVMGDTDNEAGWQAAVDLGADALQTDYPDRLLSYLRRKKLR